MPDGDAEYLGHPVHVEEASKHHRIRIVTALRRGATIRRVSRLLLNDLHDLEMRPQDL